MYILVKGNTIKLRSEKLEDIEYYLDFIAEYQDVRNCQIYKEFKTCENSQSV